ncbi:hypothetical protein TWF506_005369 [Arthrobotrys conoides]|uniref:Uncharacterized protein n=1 Tax=Arthrobotrys conoides TaxID=74498 RepID=A0AAN8NBP8_9PEZI
MAEYLDHLVNDVNAAYDSLIHILDLKQKQAALLVAREANAATSKSEEILRQSQKISKQLLALPEESRRGGDITLLFTVTTITFLPLSTIASLFSVNAMELNDGRLPISTVFGTTLPISVMIVTDALILAFNDAAREVLFGFWNKEEGTDARGNHNA